MPAPSLKHYGALCGNTGVTATIVTAVPAARALAISKITVSCFTGPYHVTIAIGGKELTTQFPMQANEVYTETGLVALAGEAISVTATGTGAVPANINNSVWVNVFGQEVDN